MLLATECVIKAVESRLTSGVQNRQAMIDRALRDGFVLVPALADGLAVYEKQLESMRLYFPDLVGQIDLAREDKRLDKVQFAKEATVKKAKHAAPRPEPVLTGAEKTLEEGERYYGKRDLERARQSYIRVLQQTGDKALNAKRCYGLAAIQGHH